MPGFFESLNQLPKPAVKKHVVKVQGKSVEVSLQKKIEIMTAGEEKYHLKQGEVVLKPIPKTNRNFAGLRKDEHGYVFYGMDPYWVQGIDEEGFTWQIESE